MIEKLQSAMLDMPQVEIETSHSFCDGVYAREIKIPKGVVLVGAKHRTKFFMVISEGQCVISDGGVETIYTAPCTIISKAGAKRAITALENTTLTTFHPTKETDIEKIEHQIIEPEGLQIANNPTEIEMDRIDHAAFLIDCGISEESEREVMSITHDIDYSEIEGIEKKESKIHGVGIFATRQFNMGDAVAVANQGGKRTLAGRFTNHSAEPNAIPMMRDGDIALVAISNIEIGIEITINYRDSISLMGG